MIIYISLSKLVFFFPENLVVYKYTCTLQAYPFIYLVLYRSAFFYFRLFYSAIFFFLFLHSLKHIIANNSKEKHKNSHGFMEYILGINRILRLFQREKQVRLLIGLLFIVVREAAMRFPE